MFKIDKIGPNLLHANEYIDVAQYISSLVVCFENLAYWKILKMTVRTICGALYAFNYGILALLHFDDIVLQENRKESVMVNVLLEWMVQTVLAAL